MFTKIDIELENIKRYFEMTFMLCKHEESKSDHCLDDGECFETPKDFETNDDVQNDMTNKNELTPTKK